MPPVLKPRVDSSRQEIVWSLQITISRIRRLSSDAFVYGIGGLLAKGISVFTIPILTRVFSPADYGTIEMLTVLSSFLGATLAIGMDSAQSMYFFKHRSEGKGAQASLISAILQWRLIWGGVIVASATLLAPLLNALFFEGRLGIEYFAIAFVSTLFAQVLSQSAEVMRLLYRPWSYIGIVASQSVLSSLLVLLFVFVFDQGILGFFIGGALSAVAVAIWGWYLARDYISFERLHNDRWAQLVRFGAPLVPAGLAFHFMSTADRWFVQYYEGVEALGVYAVGAKFALLLTLAVETFRKAWWPIAMDSMHSDDGPHTFRLIAQLYMGVACAGVVALTAMSPWLITWLTGPEFHEAWPLVGILAWQAVFYGLVMITSAGIWKAERTHLNLPLLGGGAVLGLVLNWLLVPFYGGVGAAIATAITYFFWAFASAVVSNRFWFVSYPLKIIACQILIAVSFVVLFVLNNKEISPVSLIVASLAVFSLLLLSLPSAVRKMLLKG